MKYVIYFIYSTSLRRLKLGNYIDKSKTKLLFGKEISVKI